MFDGFIEHDRDHPPHEISGLNYDSPQVRGVIFDLPMFAMGGGKTVRNLVGDGQDWAFKALNEPTWELQENRHILDFGAATANLALVLSGLSNFNSDTATLAYRARLDVTDTFGYVPLGTDTTTNWWYQYADEGNDKWYIAGSAQVNGTDDNFFDGLWHDWVWTSQSSPANLLQVFVDKTLIVSSATAPATAASGVKSWAIGRWVGGTAHTMGGAISHMRFCDWPWPQGVVDEYSDNFADAYDLPDRVTYSAPVVVGDDPSIDMPYPDFLLPPTTPVGIIGY